MHSQMYAFAVVGLPDAVQESRDRARSARENSGFTFPARRITIDLTVSGEVAVVVTSR
jgi:magnesium chelatase family protein